MTPLAGARIGLLEARLSSELAELVRREGGEPVCAPAVAESPVDVRESLPTLIDDIRRGRVQLFVFLTGAGATSMFAQADAIGALEPLLDALRRVTTVCRGPKPSSVLRKQGIPIGVNARSPYATKELLEELPASLVAGRSVALLHDGGGNPPLVASLRERGAVVRELRTYEWSIPADVEPIERLITEAIAGRLDALAFTNQVQVRHLFEIAARMGVGASLGDALVHRTVVGSIGRPAPPCWSNSERHRTSSHRRRRCALSSAPSANIWLNGGTIPPSGARRDRATLRRHADDE